jgi:hypothetical protein
MLCWRSSTAKEATVTINLKTPSPALVVACIALLVALGPAVHAANTVFSSDIVDGEVKTADIANGAVTFAKLAPNSVRSENVLANSLTAADIKGAEVNGAISLAAGAVANGRCRDFTLAIPGAAPGEAVVLSLRAAASQGMLFYGVRVPIANQVIMKVCNLSGLTSPAFNSFPIRVLTIG